MADTTETEMDDPFLLAGEYVLGTLEGEELSEARRLQLSSPDFASAVDWWEWKLGAIAEAAGSYQPSPDVWRGIVARLDAEDLDNRDAPDVVSIDQPTARPQDGASPPRLPARQWLPSGYSCGPRLRPGRVLHRRRWSRLLHRASS